MLRVALIAACCAALSVTKKLQSSQRRDVLAGFGSTAAATLGLAAPAQAAGKGKIVVVGGAGFVGKQVSQLLARNGQNVVSVSRRSVRQQEDAIQFSQFVSYVSRDASKDDLSDVFKGASAVISCVGYAPGSKNQKDNGAVNKAIADAAAKAKVPRFVYISVASAISDGPGKFLFGDYMKGKAQAEAAVSQDFGATNSLIIRPAVISGPGAPLGPPPPPGVPSVDVDAVARAAVAGALGKKSGIVDGRDEIVAL
mmetsp:Transcript_6360/g.20075  ORF Transcript_6360/g.20075 Transcript_6360/m.20075 type:complete len:254 (-) Transcript_6360:42-803(-)